MGLKRTVVGLLLLTPGVAYANPVDIDGLVLRCYIFAAAYAAITYVIFFSSGADRILMRGWNKFGELIAWGCVLGFVAYAPMFGFVPISILCFARGAGLFAGGIRLRISKREEAGLEGVNASELISGGVIVMTVMPGIFIFLWMGAL